jgi:hypothetical protein
MWCLRVAQRSLSDGFLALYDLLLLNNAQGHIVVAVGI